jgi:hypothetical protein
MIEVGVVDLDRAAPRCMGFLGSLDILFGYRGAFFMFSLIFLRFNHGLILLFFQLFSKGVKIEIGI